MERERPVQRTLEAEKTCVLNRVGPRPGGWGRRVWAWRDGLGADLSLREWSSDYRRGRPRTLAFALGQLAQEVRLRRLHVRRQVASPRPSTTNSPGKPLDLPTNSQPQLERGGAGEPVADAAGTTADGVGGVLATGVVSSMDGGIFFSVVLVACGSDGNGDGTGNAGGTSTGACSDPPADYCTGSASCGGDIPGMPVCERHMGLPASHQVDPRVPPGNLLPRARGNLLLSRWDGCPRNLSRLQRGSLPFWNHARVTVRR